MNFATNSSINHDLLRPINQKLIQTQDSFNRILLHHTAYSSLIKILKNRIKKLYINISQRSNTIITNGTLLRRGKKALLLGIKDSVSKCFSKKTLKWHSFCQHNWHITKNTRPKNGECSLL